MSIFCKHKWEKVSEIVSQSAIQQLDKALIPVSDIKEPDHGWLGKPYMVIVKCDKCGKIKRFEGVL